MRAENVLSLDLAAAGALAKRRDILQRLACQKPAALLRVRRLLFRHGSEDRFPDIAQPGWDVELDRRDGHC